MADKNIKLKDNDTYLYPQTKVANIIDLNSASNLTTKTIDTQIKYATTEPTAAATGGLRFAVLDGEPTTHRDGWFYIDNKKYDPYITFWCPEQFILGDYDSKNTSFIKGWDGTMEYSTDKINWSIWDGVSGPITSSLGSDNNYYLYLRGTNNTYLNGSSWAINNMYVFYKPDYSGQVSNIHIDGNIEVMLDYQKVSIGLHPQMADYSMCGMFQYQNIVNTPELPAKNLSNFCYYCMFCHCTLLTTLPILPATYLPSGCYWYMFGECTNIKLSTTQTGEYQIPYRIPSSGTGSAESSSLSSMFESTGGTFTGTPEINTTYYLYNQS